MEYIINKLKRNNIKVSVVNDQLKLEVPEDFSSNDLLQEIKDNKQELIAYITHIKRVDIGSADIPKCKKKNYHVLSSVQQRLYFLHQLDKESQAYNLPEAVILNGELDRIRLQNVFDKLVDRHEALRTSFVVVGDQAFQKIHDDATIVIEQFRSTKEEVSEVINDFIRPFDLSQGPLIRVGLIESQDSKQGDDINHILLVDMHHIITDGVSQGVLVEEFKALYSGQDLAPLHLQYKDFAEWQQSPEQLQVKTRQQEFWMEMFADELTSMELPLDRERPSVSDHTGHTLGFNIDKHRSKKLIDIAEAQGATMFMVVLSIYYVLLSKLSNQEDIVIGTPTAGRQHADLERVIGMFVNTLPIRNSVNSEFSYLEFLSQVKSQCLLSFENQGYPYEELLENLKIERDTRRNPLFDVMLSYQNIDSNNTVITDVKVSAFGVKRQVSKFDLSLSARDDGEQVYLAFEYDTHLFDEQTIKRFTKYFDNIVSQITTNENIKLRDIDVLPADEKDCLLKIYNHTNNISITEATVLDVFDHQVGLTPQNVAIRYVDKNLTYEQVDAISWNIANHLHSVYRIKKGSLVGVILKKDEYLIPCLLGILKVGAAYVPIDSKYPADRQLSIIEDAQLNTVISRPELVMSNVGDFTNIVHLEDIIEPLPAIDIEPLEINIRANDLAYVIYTSGSTGKPKGVMIEHGSLSNIIMHLQFEYPLNESGTYLFKTSHTFDVSCAEIFGWFHSGGTVSVLESGEEANPLYIIDLIDSHKITHVNFVPSMFSIFVEELKRTNLKKINSIKYFMLAGETLSPQLVKNFHRLGTDISLINIYGPTEATIYSCGYFVPKDFSESVVPIGKPVANAQLYVLDKYMKILPLGAIGELYIGGTPQARGYLNNDLLTSEHFVENPYHPGEKIYKTGDLVRWTANGNIVFIGRADHQVKIRGFRIELGEIEYQLATYNAIRDVLVMAREINGEQYLQAFYTTSDEVSEQDLRSHLKSRLPEFMLPAYFIELDALPLTTNGKIDRKALPNPSLSVKEYTPPQTVLEEQLVDIWSEVLQLDENKISVTKSFFELGGHSLRATVLVNIIRSVIGAEVPLREVFNHQDIRSLASFIATLEKVESVAIPVAEEKDFYPLSAAQGRLYFLYEFDKESLAYNMPEVVKLKGNADLDRLEKVFTQLTERHESLRTNFVMHHGMPVQRIKRPKNFEFEVFEGDAEQIKRLVSTFIRPFDLESDNLIRGGVINLTDSGECILMLDMHHIITDGVSQSIMISEFIALFNDQKLEPLTLQYKDFTEWQHTDDQVEANASHKAFWLNMYKDEVSPLNLPSDYVRSAIKHDKGDSYSFQLSTMQTQSLMELAHAENVTTFSLILSIYSLLLSRLCNQEDIVIGIPVAGRNHHDLQHIIGLFVNTLPIRIFAGEQKSFKSHLKEVSTTVLSALEHQTYPYEELVEQIGIERDTSRNPLFDVMFSYHRLEENKEKVSGLDFETLGTSSRISQFDLTLIGLEGKDSIAFTFEYATSLFTRDSIERFSQCFLTMIDAIIENQVTPLGKINFVSDSEMEQMKRFNDTAVTYLVNKGVLDYYRDQLHVNGTATAIICDNEKLTYRELDAQINRLANYLIENVNIKIEDRVAVYMNRSPLMIVAIMAIMKAGGTYLPLDPNYPIERITTILTAARPNLLITDLYCTFDSLQVEVFNIDKDASTLAEFSTNDPLIKLNGADSAYIIYTSGSTGVPKGILIEHNSLIDYILTCQHKCGLTKDDVVVQQASIAFDISVEEIFVTLTMGGMMVIMPDGGRDIHYMVETIHQHKCTFLSTTPLVLGELNSHVDKLDSLRVILSGGDMLLPGQINRLIDKHVIYNTYGPSESSICVTYNRIEHLSNTSLIGKPLNNREVYILNKQGSLCPLMVPGELCVAGPGLAREYFGREDLTKARFVYHDDLQRRIYKTGDLVRWLPDGNIEFLGRIDDQLKIRGYRVELGEVQKCLIEMDSIDEVAVLSAGNTGQKYLIAYYILKQAGTHDSEQIRGELSKILPSYMVPAHFVEVDEMPMTTNGKLDRKKLSQIEVKETFEILIPKTDTERGLAEIWTDVLNRQMYTIGVNVNFFELGGQSLKATRMLYAIKDKFSVSIPLVDIFSTPTIRDIARKIEIAGGDNHKGNECVVLLNDRTSAQNLFLIHDGSGDIHGYLPLANILTDYNSYALRSPYLSELAPLNRCVEQIASEYIEIIRNIQPEGPYKIGGWSTGGTLAYEIVRQMEIGGADVDMLVMFDTVLPNSSEQETNKFQLNEEVQMLRELLPEHIENLERHDSIEELWSYLADQMTENQIQKLIPIALSALIPYFETLDIRQLISYVNTIRTLDLAISNYKMKGVIKAPLIFIKASETEHNNNLISKFFEKEINYSQIEGDHFSILKEPLVRETKEALVNATSGLKTDLHY